MNGRQSDLADAPAGRVFNLFCPTDRRAGCSLRTAVLDAAPGKNGFTDSQTECEIEIFLSLAPGQRIAVRDHETGAIWRGRVDMTFHDHGFGWVITDVGERGSVAFRNGGVAAASRSGCSLKVLRDTLWHPAEDGPEDGVPPAVCCKCRTDTDERKGYGPNDQMSVALWC
jgi:hypothetical protein